MQETLFIPVEKVYNFIQEVFIKMRVPKEEARICADILIESDLRGIESHGVGRLKMYYDRIKSGVQKPVTKIDVISDDHATAAWDGNHGMGHVIAYKAMQKAIEKAKKYGIGSVAVRNSTHYGIAGYYPKMAIEQNMIGISMTNARSSISPTWGVEPMLGTNPIAFGAPSDFEFDFLYDGATSIIQRGKIEVLDKKQEPTPEGWVINENAKPLLDSKQILIKLAEQKASLLPLGGVDEFTGGHKGYGLATIVEILSAALQGGSYLHALSGIEKGKKVPFRLGHFFMAINVEAFIELSAFKKITGNIMRDLTNSTKAPGREKIFIAGEKEYYKGFEIRKKGVPINKGLQKNLNIIIDESGLINYKSLFTSA